MQTPTLAEIDSIRKEGFRPQVVGCIIANKQILFVYKEKYNLWQLPQGGINNNETIKQAIIREMTEELGKNFASFFKISSIVSEDKLIFPEQNQGSRKLKTDDTKEVFMLGKKYFFVVINTNNTTLNITKTEFENYKWLDYIKALEITKKIYQPGKQQITVNGLNSLHKHGLL